MPYRRVRRAPVVRLPASLQAAGAISPRQSGLAIRGEAKALIIAASMRVAFTGNAVQSGHGDSFGLVDLSFADGFL